LVERFVSADCEACWSAPPTKKPEPNALVIDWIVPSGQGDVAPLAAAASRDAQLRLDFLGRSAPATSAVISTEVLRDQTHQLSVAQGLPVGAYIGAIIEYKVPVKARHRKPVSVWLLLVETIAPGADGAQEEKNLVRNMLVSTWDRSDKRSKTGKSVFRELRPLNIAQGARPEHLRVVGWVQDAQGRVLTAAQSVCTTPMETR
jgi:hypothetical protein